MQRLVLSRLDYCNSVLAGLSTATVAPLQIVLHAAVRLIAHLASVQALSHGARSC